jgi:hypothetical protein
MYMLAAVFCIGSASLSISSPLKAISIGLSLMIPLVIAQSFGYQGIVQVASPAGLFINRNVFAEACAVLFVAMLYLKAWWYLPPLIVGLILTQERAAFMGIALSLIAYLAMNRKNLSRRMLMVLCAALLGLILTVTATTYFSRMDRSEKVVKLDFSAKERVDMWLDTVDGFTVLGRGIGSYYVAFPEKATRMPTISRRPEYAHNEPLHFAFELGFPLHMPLTAFIAALCAGRLCSNRFDVRSVCNDGGIKTGSSF